MILISQEGPWRLFQQIPTERSISMNPNRYSTARRPGLGRRRQRQEGQGGDSLCSRGLDTQLSGEETLKIIETCFLNSTYIEYGYTAFIPQTLP